MYKYYSCFWVFEGAGIKFYLDCEKKIVMPYKLHHLGLLCVDLTASARFFTDVLEHQKFCEGSEDHFCFRLVFEWVYDRGTLVYLANSFFDVDRRQAMIKIWLGDG